MPGGDIGYDACMSSLATLVVLLMKVPRFKVKLPGVVSISTPPAQLKWYDGNQKLA